MTGTVFLEGTAIGIPGVTVSYTINGSAKTPLTTTASGSYTIAAQGGDVVIITNIAKNNYALVDALTVLPSGPYDQDITGIDFEMRYVPDNFTVSGTVYLDGTPLGISGVTISYTINGAVQTPETTDVNGAYTLIALVGDSIVITGVAKTNYTVTAGTVPSAGLKAAAAGVDFEMEQDKFTVSGTVYLNGTSTGISGVTISYEIGGTVQTPVVTDTNGGYEISALAGETVVITGVTRTNYTLTVGTVPSAGYTAAASGVDFEMEQDKFTVSGTVYLDSTTTGIFGVTVSYTIDGSPKAPLTTDSSGAFAITALSGQTIVITGVAKTNYYLTSGTIPSAAYVTTAAGVNFEMEYDPGAFVVSGNVYLDGTTIGIQGVSVSYTIDGAAKAPVTTDVNGVYAITAQVGQTIVITDVAKANYTLTAGTVPTADHTATATGVDFELEQDKFTVSGRVVLHGTAAGISGVTISYEIDGVAQLPVITGPAGDYTLTAFVGETIEITGVARTNYTLVSGAIPSSAYVTAAVGVNFELEQDKFTVSGSVFFDGTAIGIPGVTVSYEVNGIAQAPVSTGTLGDYTIAALVGDTVVITNVAKVNYALKTGTIPSTAYSMAVSGVDFGMEDIPSAFTLSGNVYIDGTSSGIPGVSVSYTINGAIRVPEITDVNGAYAITALVGQTIVITGVTKTNYVLTAGIIPTAGYGATAAADFGMAYIPPLFTVSGTVYLDGTAVGISGVTISYTVNGAPQTPIYTDASGSYMITASEGQTVTVTGVAKTNYVRTSGAVPSASYGVSVSGVDFKMEYSPGTFAVSGSVYVNGTAVGIPGATVNYTINGVPQMPVYTNPAGGYTITATVGQNIVLTGVSKTYYTLASGTIPSSSYAATASGVNFGMVQDKFTVSGNVYLEGTTAGIPGVTVSYTVGGVAQAPLTTDGGGHYEIEASAGQVVVITDVTKSDYTLTHGAIPSSNYVSTAVADFEMEQDKFSVSGTVYLNGTSAGISTVTISYSIDGVAQPPLTTGPLGDYSITALVGQTITITGVAKTNFTIVSGTVPSAGYALTTSGVDFEMEPVPTVFTVSGNVYLDSTVMGIMGVAVSYTVNGAAQVPEITDIGGAYVITALTGQTVVITGVSKAGYTLTSGTVPTTGYAADTVSVNFEMDRDKFIVSGTVYLAGGVTGVPGATVSYEIDGAPQPAITTGPLGEYSITALVGEAVVITDVAMINHTLISGAAPSPDYATATTADFEMEQDKFIVSGTVYLGGGVTGVPGVTVSYTIDGVPQAPVTTDSGGEYAITVLAGQTVVVTGVAKTNYDHTAGVTPTPGYVSAASGVNFEIATPISIFTVSGSVYIEGTTTGISGVSVSYTIDGAAQAPETTDINGAYAITALVGQTITVTGVTKTNYTLSSGTVPSAGYTAAASGVDFGMERDSFVVSGAVYIAGKAVGISGVTVSYMIDGVPQPAVTTGPTGVYSITALAGQKVVITDVAKSDYTRTSGAVPSAAYDATASGVNFRMEQDKFTVSGNVYLDATAVGVIGVAVSYTVDGVPQAPEMTDASGVYVITALAGQTVVITDVAKTNYTLVSGTVPSAAYSKITSGVNFEMRQDPVAFTVSGTVYLNGSAAGLPGVTVSYTIDGASQVPETTDVYGAYAITALIGQTVVITDVSKTNYTLIETVPSPGYAGAASADFNMDYSPGTFAVSGMVCYMGTSVGIPGAAIYYTNNGVPQAPETSDASGAYVINALAGDTVVITDVLKMTSYTLTAGAIPSSNYSLAATNVDFELERDSFTLTGMVYLSGTASGIPSVAVHYTANGVPQAPVSTDASGVYVITALVGETVVITDLVKANYSPAPGAVPSPGHSASSVGVNLGMVQDKFTVSGTVYAEGTAAGISGVTVSYSINGVPQAPVATNASGAYVITASVGDTVVITGVSKASYTLTFGAVPSPNYIAIASGADFQMKYDGSPPSGRFVVSGAVVVDGDGSPVQGAVVSYTVNGGSTRTATTDPNGRYSLTANTGDTVRITGVEKPGYVRVTPLPSPFASSAVYNCVMSPDVITVTVNVTTDEHGALMYMKDNDGVWTPLTPDPYGRYVIYGLQSGTPVRIMATPDDERYTVLWIDETRTSTESEIYAFTATFDRDLEVRFLSEGEGQSWLPIMIGALLAALIVAGLLIFLLWGRRCIVACLVTSGDDGLEKVRIDYAVDNEAMEPVFTDRSGNYRIRVAKDAEVLFTGVTLEGYVVIDTLPLTVIAEKGVVEASFAMQKKD
ncbi:MAG: hypothetical protein FWH47_01240 [Methanomassiliicoccaceae archaeon]|nr:hypothetical protein [Methanomassiliicoccaceae archaeon]